MSSVLGCNTSTSDPVSLLKAINEKLSKVLSGRSFDNDRLNVTVQPEKIVCSEPKLFSISSRTC